MFNANKYKTIAEFYSKHNIDGKAKQYYKKAIEKSLKHIDVDTAESILNMSDCCVALGIIYEFEDNYAEAEKYYIQSLESLQTASKYSVVVPVSVLLKAYYNLADFYRINDKETEALNLYDNAIVLADENRIDNEDDLVVWANCYYGKGSLIGDRQKIVLYEKAVEIYRSLEGVDFDIYYSEYLESLRGLSVYYLKRDNIDKGMLFLEESLPLLEYAFEQFDDYFVDIIRAYRLYAALSEEKDIEAIPSYTRILELCEKNKDLLTQIEIDIVCDVCKKLSLYCFEHNKLYKAKDYSTLQIEMLNLLINKNKSEDNLYKLATTYQFLAELYFEDETIEDMKLYCANAIKILEELSASDKVKYSSNLAYGYVLYGKITFDEKYIKKAYKTAELNPTDSLSESIIREIKMEYPDLLLEETDTTDGC